MPESANSDTTKLESALKKLIIKLQKPGTNKTEQEKKKASEMDFQKIKMVK